MAAQDPIQPPPPKKSRLGGKIGGLLPKKSNPADDLVNIPPPPVAATQPPPGVGPSTPFTETPADLPVSQPPPFPSPQISQPLPPEEPTTPPSSGVAPISPPTGAVPPPPVAPGSSIPAPPDGKKKGLPKNLLFILGGVLIIAVLVLVVTQVVLPLFSKQAEQTTLTWWGLWEDEAIIAPIIAEYEAANPEVKINYAKQSQQDYRERLTNSLAKNQGPDIFRFHNTWTPMFASQLAAVPADVVSPAEFAQTYYPVIASDLTVGTSIVGLPLDFDTIGLYINEEIFEANGKVAPTTWDDLRQTAIELTVKDENGVIKQAGVSLGRTENVDHWEEILALMMLQNGVTLSNPTGELGEAAMTFYTLFSNVDGVWDETLPTSTVAFSGGKLAMYFGPSWRAHEIRQQNPDLKFKVVPAPQLPKDTPDQPDVAYATYWVEGVWGRGENTQAAWNFLKFVSSKDSLQSLYTAASQTRLFGEPYPRADMGTLLAGDPIVGAFVAQGPNAQSWYLASRTFDGPTGINSQMSGYFEDGVNAINEGSRAQSALEAVASGISQVLNQYGISSNRR